MQVFHNELLHRNREEHFLPDDVIPQMFSNIKSIYQFHHDFLLPQLDHCLANWLVHAMLDHCLATWLVHAVLDHCLANWLVHAVYAAARNGCHLDVRCMPAYDRDSMQSAIVTQHFCLSIRLS